MCNKHELSNLHEIEIRQAEECEEENQSSQTRKKGHTWTCLQKPRSDHTISLDVVVGQKRSKQTTFHELET